MLLPFQHVLKSLSLMVVGLVSVAHSSMTWAQSQTPYVTIIIDDLGYSKRYADAFINMNEPLTLAILPHTPHAKYISRRARETGNEVMLHLPMESMIMPRDEAPGVLKVSMDKQTFQQTLLENLSAVEGYTGVNNHMGSRLMKDPQSLEWVMQEVAQRKLFFVDSKTIGGSPASKIAKRHGITTTIRDIFLDSKREKAFISQQFDLMVKKAKKTGHVVAIGHPYAETISVLQDRLPELAAQGIKVVPVHQYMASLQGVVPSEENKTMTPAKTLVPVIENHNQLPSLDQLPALRYIRNQNRTVTSDKLVDNRHSPSTSMFK